jgi:hypothetical protein
MRHARTSAPTVLFRTPKTYDLPSRLTDIVSRYFLVLANSCNWFYFQ